MTLTKRASLIMLAIAAAATLTGSRVSAHESREQSLAAVPGGEPTIVGAWRTRVRPLNCGTGEIIPASPIRGLFTFHGGGTLSEYGIGPGSSPALRSPGHGVWQREPGWQDYSFAFTDYRYDGAGLFVESQRVRAALVLEPDGDTFVSKSTVEVLDANDNVILTVCATAAGTRFE